jgi:hypothetical protein
MRATSKWHFFLGLLNECLKIVLKIWSFISYSNQAYLEHERKLFSNFHKGLSNGVWHTPIKAHLTLALKGFVAESQILNLIPNPSFHHNSCVSNLNEQCEGTLGSYTSRLF